MQTVGNRAARPGWGIFWMVVTGGLFIGVTALVKYLGPSVPAPQSAFLRYLLGLVFFIPVIPRIRSVRLSARQWRLVLQRGLAHTLGVLSWFYAMTRIPIADVTALNYLTPVYVTLAATVVLGEKLAVRRIFAIFAALGGALLILRPGFRELDNGHLAMLGAGLALCISYLIAKTLSDELPPAVVVGLLSFTVTVGLAPLAWMVWVPVDAWTLFVLFGVAACATGGHYTMTLAFREAPVTVTQPVFFLQLIWATLLGVLVFGEPLDIGVITGGAVILASVTYITWREAILKRRVTPPTNPAKL